MDYYEDSVDTGANTSRVVASTYMYTSDEYGWTHSGSPGTNMYIDGTGFSGSGNYSNIGSHNVGSKGTLVSTQTKTVAHDANGTKSVWMSAYHNADQSGLTTAEIGFTFTLTTINRYAAISSYTHSLVTDTSLRLNVSTDVACNLLEYNVNGAGWVTGYSGSFTSQTVDLSNLLSNTYYSIQTRVTRSDSGLTTTSSAVASTTGIQNNFFGFIKR
jgi:hypothetical protein